MTIIQAIILGVIQGLTEFLPISSSAHLNLFPWLLKWQSMPDSFDVALHVGTLLAIVVYFFKDWIKLIVGGYKQVVKKEKTIEGKIFWQLVIATIPAGILSLILDKISSKICPPSDNPPINRTEPPNLLFINSIISEALFSIVVNCLSHPA